MASDTVALQGRLPHAPGDLLREVSRVKLGHALQDSLQDDTFRFLGNALCGRCDLHAVLPEPEFEECAVCPVPGKAVELPHHHILPGSLLAVPYHLLEVKSLLHILPGRGGSVYIDGGNAVAIQFAKGSAITELPFNGLFPLPFRAEPEI